MGEELLEPDSHRLVCRCLHQARLRRACARCRRKGCLLVYAPALGARPPRHAPAPGLDRAEQPGVLNRCTCAPSQWPCTQSACCMSHGGRAGTRAQRSNGSARGAARWQAPQRATHAVAPDRTRWGPEHLAPPLAKGPAQPARLRNAPTDARRGHHAHPARREPGPPCHSGVRGRKPRLANSWRARAMSWEGGVQRGRRREPRVSRCHDARRGAGALAQRGTTERVRRRRARRRLARRNRECRAPRAARPPPRGNCGTWRHPRPAAPACTGPAARPRRRAPARHPGVAGGRGGGDALGAWQACCSGRRGRVQRALPR